MEGLPVTGLKITTRAGENPTKSSQVAVIVEWSDFNQQCEEPAPRKGLIFFFFFLSDLSLSTILTYSVFA